MVILAWVFCVMFGLRATVNTGWRRGDSSQAEIAFGQVVDYAAIKGSYSFMARLVFDGQRCGGAVIAERHLVTARHCLVECPCFGKFDDWTKCSGRCFVKLREHNDMEVDTETVHQIKRIHIPENSGNPYNTSGQKTDLAMIELVDSVNTCTEEETQKGLCWPITPVRLPDPFIYIKPLQEVRTLGWGSTEDSFENEQSEFLRELDVTVNSSTKFHYLLETNIGVNGADPCRGDSGGPLLLEGDDLQWTLVAVVLGGGYACENPGGKDATSDWNKLSVHVPWIRSIIGDQKVDCEWGNWEAWGSCSASCGYSDHTRHRKIKQPALKGGDECSGSDYQSEDCNLIPDCPVDGRWTNWGSWSTVGSCSGTCGGGQQQYQRRRTCSNPRPEYNGNNCPGVALATTSQSCNTQSCTAEPPLSTPVMNLKTKDGDKVINANILFSIIVNNQKSELLNKQSELPTVIDTTCSINYSDATVSNVTPLYMSCSYKQPEIATILLSAGANPNIVSVYNANGKIYRQSPLYRAAAHGMSSTVQQLLDSGASIDYANSDSDGSTHMTALYIACALNNPGTVNILINAGANINIARVTDKNIKITPLFCAVYNGMVSTVQLLMSKGARTDIDSPGNLLSAAKYSGDQFLINMFN